MSFTQLQAILKEGREEAVRQAAEPPVDCPNDGEPLLFDEKRGILWCPFDGWQTSGRPKEA